MPIDQNLSDQIDTAAEAAATEAAEEAKVSSQPEDAGASDGSQDGEAQDEDSSDSDGDSEARGLADTGSEGGQAGPKRGDERGEEDSGSEAEEPGGDEEAGKSGERQVDEPSGPSEDALIQALAAGIPLADARTFTSDEMLYRAIDTVHAAAREHEGTDEGSEESAGETDPLALFPELDPEEYDPKVIEAFEAVKGIVKAQHEAIVEFREQQEQSSVASAQAVASEVEKWFDGQVESLGEDFSESLGKGRYSDLHRGSSQLAKRDAIANQMAVLLAGCESTGTEAPPREEVFDAAARLVLRDEFASVRERKLASDLKGRSEQHIQRPGGKKSKKTKSPWDSVADEIDEKFFSE